MVGIKQLHKFFEYVMSFYGPGGVYEFEPPATVEEIKRATEIRLNHLEVFSWGGGDSVDREIVRDIMLAQRGAPEEELEYKWTKGLM